jgi:hypothetical protein
VLAAEAARLAAQLGVTVPELTIPPTDIPLLASKLPDVMGVSAAAPLLKSNVGPSAELCSSIEFQNLVSRLKAPFMPELFAMGSTPQYTSQGSGLEVGGDLGLFAFQKPSLPTDALSMATCMKPVYDLSNALLVAARAEVEQMMAQIMAQNASSALLHAQAKSALQAQSTVTLPMSLSLSTPAFPAINPAISLPSLSNPQTYQSCVSVDSQKVGCLSGLLTDHEKIPVAFRSRKPNCK